MPRADALDAGAAGPGCPAWSTQRGGASAPTPLPLPLLLRVQGTVLRNWQQAAHGHLFRGHLLAHPQVRLAARNKAACCSRAAATARAPRGCGATAACAHRGCAPPRPADALLSAVPARPQPLPAS